MPSVETLMQRLDYAFCDQAILQEALTHASYGSENNERLEFLGDSVLDVVISEYLFLHRSRFREGEMTSIRSLLVSGKQLADVARSLDMGEFLRLGRGEKASGGRNRSSILADAMEAVFGAVFVDGGFEAAKGVVLKLYEPLLREVCKRALKKDAKTKLQEHVQKLHFSLPYYQVLTTEGREHDKTFFVQCYVKELGIVTKGKARSRRLAEQEAAHLMLDRIEKDA